MEIVYSRENTKTDNSLFKVLESYCPYITPLLPVIIIDKHVNIHFMSSKCCKTNECKISRQFWSKCRRTVVLVD